MKENANENFCQSSMLRYYLHNYSYRHDYALKCVLGVCVCALMALLLLTAACCPARFINLAT